MRLRQIEVFHAIYSSGSMTSAAAMLNVSQPSVSKVLAHAEQQLGYLLFDRVKGKLIPTPEAHLLFKHVSSVYKNVDRLRHVAENLKLANDGCVRIASTPAFSLEVLPRAVATFRREHANMIFEIETLHFDEMTTALTESRVDIGLAFEPVSHPDVMDITLATGRFMVLAPMDIDFDGRTSLTAEDVAPFPYIGMNSRGPLGRMLSNHLATAGVELNVVTWSETYHVAKSLVAHGAGLTITDEVTARSAGADNIQVLPLEPVLEFKVKALHLGSTPLSLGTNKFVQHLQKTLQAFLSPSP